MIENELIDDNYYDYVYEKRSSILIVLLGTMAFVLFVLS